MKEEKNSKEKPQEDIPEEQPTEETEEQPEKKESKKYVHNCTKCGKCCEKWTEIPVYLEDFQRWMKDGSINYVLPFLQLEETPPLYVRIVLKRPSVEGNDPNPSGCPLYDYQNKICNLYSSMPLHCQAYPLAYNGEKYYLVDNDSPGLGSGTMSKESLGLARQRAQEHFNALNSTSSLLPLIYSLILGNIMKRSQEAMNELSEEDRQKLDELLKKSEAEDEVTEDEATEDEATEEAKEETDDFEDLEDIEE